MVAVNIPVDSKDSYYTFTSSIDGDTYRFTLRWNAIVEIWYMDIEGLTNNVLLRGLALIEGLNLLRPYAVLEMGTLLLYDVEGKGERPTRESLGNRHKVLYISRGEFSS